MRIGSNNNLFAQRQLRQTGLALSRALERLSSGQRITRAADDPAGLAVSSGLTSQVRSLSRISESLSNTRGWLSTADGALATQREIVQRMRELALQASNGTYSDSKRQLMQTELNELYAEFNRVTSSTQFNGVKLLAGGSSASIQVGSQKGQSIEFDLPNLQASEVFVEEEEVNVIAHELEFEAVTGPTLSGVMAVGDTNGNGLSDIISVKAGSTTMSLRLNEGGGAFSDAIDIDMGFDGATAFHQVYTAELVDYDGNGNLDLITFAQTRRYSFDTGYVTRLEVFLNRGNGDGTFQTAERKQIAFKQDGAAYNYFTGTRKMAVGDINGDGIKDVVLQERNEGVAGQNQNGLRIFNGTNTSSLFQEPSISAFGDSFWSGTFTDFILANTQGNGRSSLVVGTTGDTLVRDGLEDGVISSTVLSAGGLRSSRLAAYDFDGDGKETIVSVSQTLFQFRIHADPAGSTPALEETLGLAYSPTAFAMGDLNGDGKFELILTGSGSQAQVYNRRAGNFDLAASVVVGLSNQQVITGRFNDDEYLDFIVRPNNNITSIQLTQTPEVAASWINTISAVDKLKVGTQEEAQELLAILDTAQEKILGASSEIGALQNRLEVAYSVLQKSNESLQSARSQILDTDYANDTADVTSLTILQQAQVAVTAQSNFSLQAVLALLVDR